MELRNVLAATDFSPSAEQAAERAAVLAQQHGAVLHLLHVMPTVSWTMFGRTLVEHPLITEKNLYQAARERLDNLADTFQERYAISVQPLVDIGRPYQHIADYAQQHGIDLAVLGPHAGNPARDLFVGSTASRYLRRGAHPTLIVRSTGTDAYRRVVVAVDFSDSSKPIVDAALSLAPDAELHLLHIYDVLFEGKMLYVDVDPEVIRQYREAADEEAWRSMDAFIAQLPRHEGIRPMIRSGDPATAIVEDARTLGADLIVMGKRGHSELDRFFMGSVSESVLHRADRDLLLVAQ